MDRCRVSGQEVAVRATTVAAAAGGGGGGPVCRELTLAARTCW